MDLVVLDELIRTHLRDGIELVDCRAGAPLVWPIGGEAYALVTELLRLARLGALAELRAPTTAGRGWVRFLVQDAGLAWRKLGAP